MSERMFALAGRPEPAAAAKQVMDLETRLAKASLGPRQEPRSDPHLQQEGPRGLDALTPGFDWSTYFEAAGAKDLSEVIVRQPDYFTAMAGAYQRDPAGPMEDLAGLERHRFDGGAT